MFFLIWYRNRKIIKSSQWRLSLVMCIGCLMGFATIFLYAIDEATFSSNAVDYGLLCNIRPILASISSTLVFAPLCAKVYRINNIFNVMPKKLLGGRKNQRSVITDFRLIAYIIGVLMVELIAAGLIVFFARYTRRFFVIDPVIGGDGKSSVYTLKYGTCGADLLNGWVFVIVIGIPKICVAVYCIVLAMSVYTTVSVMKFNEGLHCFLVRRDRCLQCPRTCPWRTSSGKNSLCLCCDWCCYCHCLSNKWVVCNARAPAIFGTTQTAGQTTRWTARGL